jgi:hypothetical protein
MDAGLRSDRWYRYAGKIIHEVRKHEVRAEQRIERFANKPGETRYQATRRLYLMERASRGRLLRKIIMLVKGFEL